MQFDGLFCEHLSDDEHVMKPGLFNKVDVSSAGVTWLLYISVFFTTAIWLQLSLSMISYFGYALIFVVCKFRRQKASNTDCESHLRNIQLVSLVGFIVLNIVLITIIGTLGLGAFIKLPLWLVLAGWSAFRVTRGMLILKQRRSC
jgi:hypothetical protein